MPARRVPLIFRSVVLTTVFSLATWAQTNTAAGAGTYPAQPEPNSTANLGVRPEILPWDQGEAGLHLLAKRLKNTGRIMHLTAHPDDEDGSLLTYLARGQGRQVLLMSLTRGEGGQNRTGSNLWDELGVLRTLELLESTRYYGTELRFSRVADFGFSKSADETFQKWGGHQVPLRDIVYVIREWKPDVLFSRFSGTPRDGHGHHQAAGILAPEAVKCAADPNCFPDQLKGDHALTTWQVLKLYMGNQPSGDYTVRYDVSQIDPDTKLSYTQMALEGFKHQASQLSGTFTPPSGPNWRSYKLVSTAIPNYKPEKEQDFFDGIGDSVATMAHGGLVKQQLAKAQMLATQGYAGRDVTKLLEARAAFFQTVMTMDLQKYNERSWLSVQRDVRDKPNLIDEMITRMASISASADYDGTYVVAGERPTVHVRVSNQGTWDVRILSLAAGERPSGRSFLTANENIAVAKNTTRPIALKFAVPTDFFPNVQHWFREDPEKDAIYSTKFASRATWPVIRDSYEVTANFDIGGRYADVKTPVLVKSDPSKKLPILPGLSLFFRQVRGIRSTTDREFDTSLAVRSLAEAGQATVSINAPSGWSVKPGPQTVQIKPGEQTELTFHVAPVAQSTQGKLQASVQIGKHTYASGITEITRQDLSSLFYEQPAIQRVSIVDVDVPKNLRVGYIPGAGDDIFPVLQQLGLNAKQISNDELAKGDLRQYDTIVVGIRGYDERPEIRAANQRLLDFVKDGGTLLVQNQKAEDVFNAGHFTPYPVTLGRQRVSVEEAPVEVLAPNDPIFNSPNKITQADFDGWVQERGINFMSDWDAKFEPLLACNDPGEQPLKGGLLRAKYGKGTYIYTGYAFFRQLPAGVPGAVRLYVNLLNAGHETK